MSKLSDFYQAGQTPDANIKKSPVVEIIKPYTEDPMVTPTWVLGTGGDYTANNNLNDAVDAWKAANPAFTESDILCLVLKAGETFTVGPASLYLHGFHVDGTNVSTPQIQIIGEDSDNKSIIDPTPLTSTKAFACSSTTTGQITVANIANDGTSDYWTFDGPTATFTRFNPSAEGVLPGDVMNVEFPYIEERTGGIWRTTETDFLVQSVDTTSITFNRDIIKLTSGTTIISNIQAFNAYDQHKITFYRNDSYRVRFENITVLDNISNSFNEFLGNGQQERCIIFKNCDVMTTTGDGIWDDRAGFGHVIEDCYIALGDYSPYDLTVNNCVLGRWYDRGYGYYYKCTIDDFRNIDEFVMIDCSVKDWQNPTNHTFPNRKIGLEMPFGAPLDGGNYLEYKYYHDLHVADLQVNDTLTVPAAGKLY
jgi:hypothetical protein